MHCAFFFNFAVVKVKIIDNIEDFPQFEAQNVFQTVEWMRLFEGEDDTSVVFFAVYRNMQCVVSASSFSLADARTERPYNFQLLLVQPVVIQRVVKWLPRRFGAYAVAWREPWRAADIADGEAIKAFQLMTA